MKIRLLIIFLLLSFSFAIGVEARSSGVSLKKFYVRDNQGNLIKDVKFEFAEPEEGITDRMEKFLLVDKNSYTIFFGIDRPTPQGNKKVKISADGFESFEREFFFREIQENYYNLTMKRAGTNEKVFFEELVAVYGTIKDRVDNKISNIRVVFKGVDGKTFESVSNERGSYQIEMPEGVYDVKIIGRKNFASMRHEKFEVAKKRRHLDAVLELGDANFTTGLNCVPSEYSRDYLRCTLGIKKSH